MKRLLAASAALLLTACDAGWIPRRTRSTCLRWLTEMSEDDEARHRTAFLG